MLPGQGGLEALLVLGDVSLVAVRVDEGVGISRTALLQLFVLRGQVVERGVRADPQVDRKRKSLFIGSPEVLDDSRILVQRLEEIAVQAALDKRVVGLAIFLKVGGPGEAAPGVTGHDVGRQGRSAQRNRIAVVDQAVDGVFFPGRVKVPGLGCVHAPYHHLGARQLLDQVVSAHMVRMRMTGDQNLDVGELKPQFLDTRPDHRNRRLVVAVHQDVPLGRDEQKGGQLLGSHIMEIVHDAMRRERIVPPPGLSKRRQRQQGRQHQCAHDMDSSRPAPRVDSGGRSAPISLYRLRSCCRSPVCGRRETGCCSSWRETPHPWPGVPGQ